MNKCIVIGSYIRKDKTMKSKLNYVLIYVLSIIVSLNFVSCSDDDDTKVDYDTLIVGKWSVEGVSTDNKLLNETLPLMLAQLVDLENTSISFDSQGNSNIYISLVGKDAIQLKGVYAYLDGQVAFRFDDILPIPLNLFDVSSLTEKDMRLIASFSPEELAIILALVKAEDAEMAKLLETLLSTSLTDGLKITLDMKRIG